MGFTRGDGFGGFARQYWQAGGDTSVAWDTKGNAYLSCQMFNRGQPTSPQPGPVERVLRLSLDGHRPARRGTSRPVRSPSSTTRPAAGDGAARQAATDGRRPPRAARSRTASTSPGRCSPPTARATSTRPTRATTASTSARRSSSAPTARCAPNDARRPDAAGRAATRTSSRSRSPGPTARSTSCGTTSTSPACGPARVTTRAAAIPRRSQRRAAGRRQPQPGAARQVDRRRQHLLGAGEGRRLLRPARLRDLPGRPGPGSAPACPEKGETPNSIFRATNYPSGAVNPRDPKRDRRHVRLLHQPPLQRGQRLRPAGLQPRHVPAALRRRQDGGRVQQRHRDQPSTNGGKAFTGATTDVRALPATRRRRARRPVLAVGGVRPERPAGGVLLRPRLRRRRDDRVLGHQPVGHAQRQRLRHHARDDGLDAAGDRSSAACSSATTAG